MNKEQNKMPTTKKTKHNTPNKTSGLQEYGKYSSIAFELLLIIFCGVFVGYKLDSYFTNLKPLFTVSLSFISLAVSLYAMIKKLIKK
jgi:F0F1-type ATP synthase assembly protein I